MPWTVRRRGDDWCVHKLDADGQPQWPPLGCHPTKQAAQRQLAALEVNVEKREGVMTTQAYWHKAFEELVAELGPAIPKATLDRIRRTARGHAGGVAYPHGGLVAKLAGLTRGYNPKGVKDDVLADDHALIHSLHEYLSAKGARALSVRGWPTEAGRQRTILKAIHERIEAEIKRRGPSKEPTQKHYGSQWRIPQDEAEYDPLGAIVAGDGTGCAVCRWFERPTPAGSYSCSVVQTWPLDILPTGLSNRFEPLPERADLMAQPDEAVAGSTDELEKAAKKTEDGQQFGSGAYLIVGDPEEVGTWKLRIEESPGKVTVPQLGRAAAALGPGFRGQRVQASPDEKRSAARKLIGLYREHDVEDGRIPRYLWGLAGMQAPASKAHIPPDGPRMLGEWERRVPVAKVDEEQHLLYGVVIEPMVPDAHGDWLSPEEITKAAHRFLLNSQKLYDEHRRHLPPVRPVESYVTPVDLEWRLSDGQVEKVAAGSWVMVTHFDVTKPEGKTAWRDLKKGKWTGYSYRGYAFRRERQVAAA